jgi:hypothetical protein
VHLRTSSKLGATWVGFHLALFVVALGWYLTALFVGVMLDMSDLPRGAMTIAALGVGPVVTGLVCWGFAKGLLRMPVLWWTPLTVVSAAAPFVLGYALLFGLQRTLGRYELPGPPSPTGLTTILALRDAGLGIGADFYCDVRVLDGNGNVVATRECGSQHPRGGPELLRDSMRWTSPTTLEFTSRDGPERLTVP